LSQDEKYDKKGRKKSYEDNMMIPYLGMLPPQSVDFERAVIGAILLESKSLTIVSGILRTESFYLSQHAKIYAAITDLLDAGIPIDILTVTNQLRKQGELESVGGQIVPYVAPPKQAK